MSEGVKGIDKEFLAKLTLARVEAAAMEASRYKPEDNTGPASMDKETWALFEKFDRDINLFFWFMFIGVLLMVIFS